MQAQDLKGAVFCTASGVLTAAGAETVYDTTVIIDYCINGKAYTKAAVTDGVTPTTDGNTGAAFTPLAISQGCALVWAVNAAGTVAVYQGSVETLDSANAFVVAPSFAGFPDTACPFAYQILKNSSAGSEVIIGTDNWNQTGFTNVIQNVFVMPDRPQEA
jgi:hypothetical protein